MEKPKKYYSKITMYFSATESYNLGYKVYINFYDCYTLLMIMRSDLIFLR